MHGHEVSTYGPSMSGVSLYDLLQAGFVYVGDGVSFKGETACVAADGTLLYTRRSGTPERFTSLSKWAKEVALLKGLTKHYSGWFCILDRLQRPLEHLRQKYWHEKQGIPFTLPSMDKKRRRDESALDIEPRKILASTDEGISQYESIPTAQFDLGGRQSRDVDNAISGSGCEHGNCPLCNRTHSRMIGSTWSDILQVVLDTLAQIYPQKEYFALSDDIYAFIDVHWNLLCTKPRSAAWRQTCKMTLAHSRYNHLFENGYDKLMKTGFWRLKPTDNRHSSPAAPSSPSSIGGGHNGLGDEFQPAGEGQTLGLMDHQYNFRRRSASVLDRLGRSQFDDTYTEGDTTDNMEDPDMMSPPLERSGRVRSVFGLRDSNNSSPSTSRRRRPTLLSGSQTPTQRDVTVSDEELEDSGLLSQFAARVTSSLEAFSARPGKSIWADLYDFRLTDEDKAVIAAIAPKSTSELTDAERRIAELAEDNAKLRQELLTEQQTRLQMIKEFAEGSARMSDLQTDMQALQEEAKETIARAHALEDNNFAQQREIDSLLARIADLSTQMDATLASRRHEEELEAEQAKSTKLSQRVAELEGDLVNEKRKAEAAEKALQNHQMQIMDMQQKYMAMMQMFAKPHAAAPSSSTPPASGSAPSQGAANSSMPYMPSPYPSFPMGAPWMHQVVHPSQTMQPMGNSLSAILS